MCLKADTDYSNRDFFYTSINPSMCIVTGLFFIGFDHLY